MHNLTDKIHEVVFGSVSFRKLFEGGGGGGGGGGGNRSAAR